jgi:hypothetical protein
MEQANLATVLNGVRSPMKLSNLHLWIASVAITALILACSPKPEPRTVDFYATHTTERAQRMAECEARAGTLAGDPDCINARQAAMRLWSTGPRQRFDMNQPSGTAQAASPTTPSSDPK